MVISKLPSVGRQNVDCVYRVWTKDAKCAAEEEEREARKGIRAKRWWERCPW